MSKKEIWISRNPSCEGDSCFARKTAMMCMDEYAKQEAIGFAEWIVEEYWVKSEIRKAKWYQIPFSEKSEYSTTEQLYTIYQQQKEQ